MPLSPDPLSFFGLSENGSWPGAALPSFFGRSENGSLGLSWETAAPGSGPHEKPGGTLVDDDDSDPDDFFSWTDFPCRDSRAPRPWLGVGDDGRSDVSKEGRLHAGTSDVEPFALNTDEPSENSFFSSFTMKSSSDGAEGASTACLLSSGSLRALSRALFSLWAARSAFRAAAVVAATLGVVSCVRLLGLDLKSIADRLGLIVRSSFDKRSDSRATSSACCRIAMSILR